MLVYFQRSTFILFMLASSTLVTADQDISNTLAEVNNNGFPESILYDAAGFKENSLDKIDKSELVKRLENPDVQKAIIKAAMAYASQHLNESQKSDLKKKLKQRQGNEYCLNSWLKWLPFLECDSYVSNDIAISDKPELSRANFDVIKDRATCYKQKRITDD